MTAIGKKSSNSTKELRHFGWIVGSLFILLGFWKLKEIAPVPWTVGSILLLLSFTFPNLLGPLYHFWMKLGHVLGEINTRLLLAILFAVCLVPVAWIRRAFTKETRFKEFRNPNLKTYRIEKKVRNKDHFKFQF